jgi:hypothetical protein
MPHRKWDANTNALMVLEGLQGNSVAEICTEHQSSQSLYYQWRDHCLPMLHTPVKAISTAGERPASGRSTRS